MNDTHDDNGKGPVGGIKPSPDLFQKWSSAPYWGPEEGVALAFGLDPTDVVETQANGLPRLVKPHTAASFAEIARRAVSQNDLDELAKPSTFLGWAESVGLAFHSIWTSTLGPDIPVGPDGQTEPHRTKLKLVNDYFQRREKLIAEWALAPTWTLEEGACLAHGVPPHLLSAYGYLPQNFDAADSVNRLIEFTKRARGLLKIAYTSTPAQFIAWSETVGFPFDPKWIEVIGEPSVEAHPSRPSTRELPPIPISDPDLPTAMPTPEQELGTRARETLLKIIIGLAVDGYGYDPRSRRSGLPSSIAHQLSALGIPVTDETVRKYLDEGAKLLSENALNKRFRGD